MSRVRLFSLVVLLGAVAWSQDDAASRPASPVTWSEHIAPIVFKHCTECHRPGQGAPFELLTYDDASKRAKMLNVAVETGLMPPWHPDPKVQAFRHARVMTPREKELIGRWSEQGAPEGDPKRAPSPPKYPPDGWRLGTPDLVVSMPQGFPVPATGPDIYRSFVLPVGLPEDRWVKAVEMRTDAPSVVHHVLYFLDDTGEARQRRSRDGKPGFRSMGIRGFTGGLGGWAVGATPAFLPDDLALELPKGSDIVLQTHFHPSGKPETATITIGLYFAKTPPTKRLFAFQVPRAFGALAGIDIPAGDAAWRLKGSFVVPVDVDLVGVGGHAHYLAKTLDAVAETPDGEKTPLFRIADWDFNWQGQYEYAAPVRVKAGTRIRAELVYDNSPSNPANPNQPPRRVRFGEESEDEMGSITFRCTAVNPKDEALLDEVIRSEIAGSSLGGSDQRPQGLRDPRQLIARFRQLDTNGDGGLPIGDEWPEDFGRINKLIDRDGDGIITLEEIRTLGARRSRGDRR